MEKFIRASPYASVAITIVEISCSKNDKDFNAPSWSESDFSDNDNDKINDGVSLSHEADFLDWEDEADLFKSGEADERITK